jgi:phosphate transport system substrate-binding protein
MRFAARTLSAVLAFALCSALLSFGSVAVAGVTVTGAGSTWSQIALEQWRRDVTKFGLSINYQGVGSTSGRQLFGTGSVDFGVSEIPFQPEDPPRTRQFAYLPIVAGGTSMMYNLKTASGSQIRDLKLSSATIAGIFTGEITKWSDPKIRADYGHALPDLPIRVIVRSDGSGTSAQFSAYIAATQPAAWRSFTSACGIPNAPTSFWPSGLGNCLPTGIAQKGSDGIANYIANPGLGVGAIGYLEAGYASGRNFPVAGVKNASGNYTIPTAQNVARALTHVTLNADSTSNLSGVYKAPEKNAYPISSYSYMIVPTDNSISTDKGAVLGKFIIYFACTGQQAAARLGYSPMPKELVTFAFAAEKKIPGAPDPPAITGAACPNPTLTGEFDINSSGTLPGTDLGGGSGGVVPGGDNGGGGSGGPTSGPSGSNGSGSGGGTTGPTGASGSLGPDGNVITVTQTPETLTGQELAAARRAASEEIDGMPSASATPLVVVALLILALVFGPLILRTRSKRDPLP